MVEGNTSTNQFNISDNAISALKKADLVQQFINLSKKVIVNSDLRNLCDQISSLSETITKLATAKQQINSELTIVKVVNSKLQKRVIDLKKNQTKLERYSRRNNVEFSNMPNDITYNQLESKVIQFAVSRVWRLTTITLRVVITSLFQDIVEVTTKG